MTHPLAHILAASDFESLIFTIVVAAIAGIGAIVSAAKKKQKELEQHQLQQENWQRIEQEMRDRAANATRALSQQTPGGYPQAPPPPPPPLPTRYPTSAPPPPVFAPTRSIEGPYVPPRPAPRRPAQVRTAAVPPRKVQAPPLNRPQARRQKQQKRPGIPPAPPLERVTADVEAARDRSAPRPPDVAAPRREASGTAANAAALSRWLTPATLRSQFILTEILQPPLALRPPGEHGVT